MIATTDRGGIPLLAQRVDEDEVAEALRHLLAVLGDQRGVHPVTHERLPCRRLGLGPLALVVRVDQVGAATVEVDRRAQLAQRRARCTRCASRAGPDPTACPRTARRAPTAATARSRGGRACPGCRRRHHAGAPAPASRRACSCRRCRSWRTSTRRSRRRHRPVGVAPVEHHADEPADVGDRRRGTRPHRHRQRVQRVHVGVEARLLLGGEVEVVHAQLAGLGEQRIVDVGDVAHARHAVTEVDQPPLQHVVGEVRRGVAEVGGVVRRDAARVHQHVFGRLEGNHGAARRVVQAHRHDGRPDARQLRRDPRAVAHVELQQHRRERLDRRGVRQLAGVERAAAGDAWPRCPRRRRPPRGRHRRSTRRSRSVRRSGRARWPAGGGTPRRRGCAGSRPARAAATDPRGGTSGWNS